MAGNLSTRKSAPKRSKHDGRNGRSKNAEKGSGGAIGED